MRSCNEKCNICVCKVWSCTYCTGNYSSRNPGDNLRKKIIEGPRPNTRRTSTMDDNAGVYVYTGQRVFVPYDVIHVRVQEGVKTIHGSAFESRTGLLSVYIPPSVKEIGDSAFSGCRKLKSITLSEGLENIGIAAFYFCESLISLKVPTTVQKIFHSAFQGCTALVSIELPEGLECLEPCIFARCGSLKELKIPSTVDWDFIGAAAFLDCYSLQSLEIPHGVRLIGTQTFSGCKSLSTVRIPSTVENISCGAFFECSNLQIIHFSSPIEHFNHAAFSESFKLRSVRFSVSKTKYYELLGHGCNISHHDENRDLVLRGSVEPFKSNELLQVFGAAQVLVYKQPPLKYLAMFLERCNSQPDAIFYFLSRKNSHLLPITLSRN